MTATPSTQPEDPGASGETSPDAISQEKASGVRRHRMLSALAVISLALCLAAVGLWTRSYIGKGVDWKRDTPTERFVFGAETGEVSATWLPRPQAKPTIQYWQTTLAVTVIHATMKGRQYVRVSMPLWLPTMFFSLLPMLCAAQWYRTRPTANVGRCARCGYDLRATPERCPECGTVPKKVSLHPVSLSTQVKTP